MKTDQTKPLVAIDDVTLHYSNETQSAPAVKGLSLNIGKGEFVAVVGPSGCGKSTLMKLVSGLARSTAGTVFVENEQVRRPIKIVGMAFQNPALLPWRTALENVLLPIQIVRPYRHEFRRNRASFVDRAKSLLNKVGLIDVCDQYGWQLSGGMQQRVSLCRALMHDPEILLLDEPFGALDAFTREELWDTLQLLWQQRNCTILLVTHDLVEATYLADTVHVMSPRPGRIIYTEKINLPRPRSQETRFTREFSDCVQKIRQHIGRSLVTT